MMVLRERIIKITKKVEIIIIIIGEKRLEGSCLMRDDSSGNELSSGNRHGCTMDNNDF